MGADDARDGNCIFTVPCLRIMIRILRSSYSPVAVSEAHAFTETVRHDDLHNTQTFMLLRSAGATPHIMKSTGASSVHFRMKKQEHNLNYEQTD